MTFVRLTNTNGRPLLLNYELIESVRKYRYCQYDWDGESIIEEYKTTVKLTNGNEYDVKETIEKVEKVLEGLNDNSNDNA